MKVIKVIFLFKRIKQLINYKMNFKIYHKNIDSFSYKKINLKNKCKNICNI